MHHDHMAMPPTDGGFLYNLMQWFSGNGYAPHSGCFLGDNYWVAAYVAANWIIALAYTLVALLIAQRMKRASHIPRTLMGNALLGIFVTCAVGHFTAGITTVIWPGYRFETLWHWITTIPAWIFLAHHNKFSLIVEGPHMIAESREELSQKNNELNTLYEQVTELDRVKSEFFANVSHELRTPLALILGPVSNVLAADNLTDVQRRDLEVVSRNARTVLKHVNDLLDIARMEAGKMKMYYAEVDLARLARVLASHFESAVAERQLTFTIDAPETLIVQADEDKVQRVLLNLFSNAVKFVPPGGMIACRLRYQDSNALLEVQDNGPGIPVEMRATIFERFRQVDASATRHHEGTGLGLAIVKDFVQLHGGSISVSEAPGGGALFQLILPIFAPVGVTVTPSPETAPASASHMPAPSAPAMPGVSDADLRHSMENVMVQTLEELRAREQAEAITQDTGQPLVLVVEDNREMSRFIMQTLTPDYRVASAYDGEEGLKRALDLRPDLILSDVMMPNKSGDQMIAELRAHPQMDATPIVLLTAKADDDLRIRLLREGAQDYLMKPFAPEELRARVSNLVSMKRARQVLQDELASRQQNLEELATEMTARKRTLQTALTDARQARQSAEQAREEAQALQTLVSRRNVQLTESIQEAHHRIKNNLQVITALLEMQIFDSDTAVPVEVIRARLQQIKAIALVHDLLTPESDFSEVDAARVLQQVVDLLKIRQNAIAEAVSIGIEADSLAIPAKVATALALIVNELVGNAVKYGTSIALNDLLPNSLQPDSLSSSSFQASSFQSNSFQPNSSASNFSSDSFDPIASAVSSQRPSQESEPQNAILITLRRVGAEAILTIQNASSGLPPDFNVFRDANDGLELVLALVQSDLQGLLTFGDAPGQFGHGPAPRTEGERRNGGQVNIVFPERPDAA